jgi:hypothetical protein
VIHVRLTQMGVDQVATLDMVPYSVDELTEIEPLDVNPVGVIDEKELPNLILLDWVVNFLSCHGIVL